MNKQLVQPLVPHQSARPLEPERVCAWLTADTGCNIRKTPCLSTWGKELGVMVCIISCSCWRHRAARCTN